jgi:ribosomal protein S18 acetylase RimI-like enzyme
LIRERGATDADYDALWRLHADSMRDYVAATYGWVEAEQERYFREHWAGRRAQRLLVEGDAIVAVFIIETRAAEHFLTLMEVAPSHQGRGLGSALVRRFLDGAAAAGLPARLTVMKANPRARSLYERLGFAVEGETATHFRMVSIAPARSE